MDNCKRNWVCRNAQGQIVHLLVERDSGGLRCGGDNITFSNLQDLIRHYRCALVWGCAYYKSSLVWTPGLVHVYTCIAEVLGCGSATVKH